MTFISNHKQKIISSYISATVSSHPELEKHPTLPLVYQKNRNPHQVPICRVEVQVTNLLILDSGRRNAYCCYLGQLFTPPTRTEILESFVF